MGIFEERFEKLNERQKEAVKTIEGSVLVVAGPGSGKTELLALRVAEILKETQSGPREILLLTFTDNGAINMRERLVSLIGEDAYRVNIFTFHAFAVEVINKYSSHFYNGVDYQVINEIEKLQIIENIIKALPKNNPLNTYHESRGYIYLDSIIKGITALKKGNLTKDEFLAKIEKVKVEDKEINKVISKHLESVAGKKKFDLLYNSYEKIIEELSKLMKKDNQTAKYLLKTIELELVQSRNTEKTSNLTRWKDKYFKKTSEGNFILIESEEGLSEK